MIPIAGKMYDPNQMFEVEIDSVVGPVKLNAAQMQNFYAKSYQTMGNTTAAGELQSFTALEAPKKKKTVAPKAAAPAPRKTALTKPAVSAPPQTKKPSDPVTAEERAEVSKPAKGLENTIKTSPTLLRERRKRTYLTRV